MTFYLYIILNKLVLSAYSKVLKLNVHTTNNTACNWGQLKICIIRYFSPPYLRVQKLNNASDFYTSVAVICFYFAFWVRCHFDCALFIQEIFRTYSKWCADNSLKLLVVFNLALSKMSKQYNLRSNLTLSIRFRLYFECASEFYVL